MRCLPGCGFCWNRCSVACVQATMSGCSGGDNLSHSLCKLAERADMVASGTCRCRAVGCCAHGSTGALCFPARWPDLFSTPLPPRSCASRDLEVRTEAELDELLAKLQFRLQHESIPLTEEKKIMAQLKRLEGQRERVRGCEASGGLLDENKQVGSRWLRRRGACG